MKASAFIAKISPFSLFPSLQPPRGRSPHGAFLQMLHYQRPRLSAAQPTDECRCVIQRSAVFDWLTLSFPSGLALQDQSQYLTENKLMWLNTLTVASLRSNQDYGTTGEPSESFLVMGTICLRGNTAVNTLIQLHFNTF